MSRSITQKKLYDEFLSEASLTKMKSASGEVITCIKWRNRIFKSGSFHHVFDIVKKEVKQKPSSQKKLAT